MERMRMRGAEGSSGALLMVLAVVPVVIRTWDMRLMSGGSLAITMRSEKRWVRTT